MLEGSKRGIEGTWDSIVEMVDGMITEKTGREVEEEYGYKHKNGVSSGTVVKVVEPKSKEDIVKLERMTLNLLEDIISLMFYGKDLHSDEARSESNFLAKLSTRLRREVTLSLDAPMAVGMYKNDRSVYLLVNPVRLRHTVKTVGEIVAIVRHELYHILYQHLSEAKNYSMDEQTQYVLNVAQDCEINQSSLISKTLPEGAITLDYVRKEVKDNTLGEHAGYIVYFKALMGSKDFMEKVKEANKGMKVYTTESGSGGGNQTGGQQGESGNGEGKGSSSGLGDMVGKDSHGSWNVDEISQDTMEKAVKGVVRDTYNSLSDEDRGLLSNRVKAQLNKLDHAPDVNWKDQIKRQHGRMKSLNKRKTLNRPNRRFPNRLDLKGKLPDYIVNIVMALDVSGSVSDSALQYTLGEGFHLSRELNSPFTLLQIDSELASVTTVRKPSDLDNVKIDARGGTRFQPAFDYLAENNLTDKNTLLVYVTDGYGESEDRLLRHGFNNVLWLLVGTDKKETLSCDGKGRVELLNNDNGYRES